jgi:threonyl-tRNA synthetase
MFFNALDFKEYTAQISLRDPENGAKYIGSDENWRKLNARSSKQPVKKG